MTTYDKSIPRYLIGIGHNSIFYGIYGLVFNLASFPLTLKAQSKISFLLIALPSFYFSSFYPILFPFTLFYFLQRYGVPTYLSYLWTSTYNFPRMHQWKSYQFQMGRSTFTEAAEASTSRYYTGSTRSTIYLFLFFRKRKIFSQYLTFLPYLFGS